MDYKAFLASLPSGYCPFCHEPEDIMLDDNEYCYAVPTRAPYTSDHILIIPRRHVNKIHELSETELAACFHMIDKRSDKLHTVHERVSLLLRDGKIIPGLDKTIDHLHFHLIPDIAVNGSWVGHERSALDVDDYYNTARAMKQKYLVV